MFHHLSILCIDMDSFHFHNLNQSTGMYNHIFFLHFLSYICHHSCREKIHKDLWMKDVWQYCNTAFQSITMWEEFKYAPTFLIYFFMTEYALKSWLTWTWNGIIWCWNTCSSIETWINWNFLTWISFILTSWTKVFWYAITFPFSIFWATFSTIFAGKRFTGICI